MVLAPKASWVRSSVRRLLSGAVVAALAMGTACGARPAAPDRPAVVASFYPLAWIATRVGGPDVAVVNLTPTGQEPHDVELTAHGRAAMETASVVLVVGDGFQPAIESVAAEVRGTTIEALDLEAEADLRSAASAARSRAPSLHFWLDPTRLIPVVDAVEKALAHEVPAQSAAFARRARALTDELRALDDTFSTGLAHCERNLVITNHDAFAALADRYDLEVESIRGVSPDVEASPARLAQLAQLAAEHDATTIFTETLVSPALAQSLARETSLTTAVLDPLEGLTAAQTRHGDTYISVMGANLVALQVGLGCTQGRRE